MTTGDAAAAAGLYVVPPTKDKRLGYDDINRRGDELANHMVNGGHPFSKITGTTTEAQIGNNTISDVKLKANAVTQTKILDGAISTSKLGNLVVTSTKIADGAITTAKVLDNAVTAPKIAANAVETAKIKDAAVTNAKIGAAAVTGDKVASTVTKPGTWTLEAETLVVRDDTNTDKLTLGGGFDLQTNQAGDVKADGALTLDGGTTAVRADGTVTIDAGSQVLIQSDASTQIDGSGVSIQSHATSIVIDSATAVGISSGTANNVTIDAGNALVLQGDSAELVLTKDGTGPRVYSESIRTRTYSNPANVYITAEGTLGRSTSSRRYKVDIEDAEPMPAVLEIRPRTWADLADPGRARHFGAIAEELDELGLSALVVYNPDGTPEAIAYDRIVLALIPLVRDLAARVAVLEPTPEPTPLED